MSPEQGFCISSPPVVPHGFSSSDGRMTGTEASSTASVAPWSGADPLQLFHVPNHVGIEVVDATAGPSVRTSRRSRLRLVDPHFQPGTDPACSIHLCISGPCASSRVFTLT